MLYMKTQEHLRLAKAMTEFRMQHQPLPWRTVDSFAPQPSRWTGEHVSPIATADASQVPIIAAREHDGLAPEHLYWDMWPVQTRDGYIADIAGRELWMVLAAPDRGDPELRHFEAKIRLLTREGSQWRDLGPVLPDFAVSYGREWSGSAVCDGEEIALYFTGSGDASVPRSFQQRLFESRGRIGDDGVPTDWSEPRLSLDHPREYYMPADAHEGAPGTIKAFRDPAYFRDPADGQEYLLFTASLAGSDSAFNGAVGIARRDGEGWALLPPLISADGVNNELERAHAVFHQGRYYVFWVTQSHTFASDLRHAPTGLYGMVADSLFGSYAPLNGTGLVLANPADAPCQAYSWFVDASLMVSSFVNLVADADGERFGGVPAPLLWIALEGKRAWLVGETD